MNYDEWKAKFPEGEEGPDPVDQVLARAEEICAIAAISSLTRIAQQFPNLAEKAETAKRFFRS